MCVCGYSGCSTLLYGNKFRAHVPASCSRYFNYNPVEINHGPQKRHFLSLLNPIRKFEYFPSLSEESTGTCPKIVDSNSNLSLHIWITTPHPLESCARILRHPFGTRLEPSSPICIFSPPPSSSPFFSFLLFFFIFARAGINLWWYEAFARGDSNEWIVGVARVARRLNKFIRVLDFIFQCLLSFILIDIN